MSDSNAGDGGSGDKELSDIDEGYELIDRGGDQPESLGAAATIPLGKGSKGDRTPRLAGVRRRLPNVGIGTGALLVVVALVVLAVVPTVASGLKKTPRNKVGISYGGGPFEGSRFQRVVQPGSSLFFNGFFDPLYLYPSDQQNYIISKQVGQGAVKRPDSVIAPTRDRVPAEYQVAAFFKLNIDRLRAFHEQLGLRYSAYTAGGWASLLQDTLRQQIESALQEETRKYPVSELIGSAQVLVNIQQQVQAAVTQQLIAALGQQFFCGPTYSPGGTCGPITFVIKKVDIPTNVQNAFNLVQQRTSESASIDIISDALRRGGQNYVLLRAIESGKTTFWVVPNGTDLTLQTPGANGTPGTSSTPSTTTTTTAPSTSTTAGSGP